MATKEQGQIVKAAVDKVFEAVQILSAADIDRVSFSLGGAAVALHISGSEDGFVFQFSAQKIVVGDPEDDAKLPGMTPNAHAFDRPIDIDKGDLS